MGFFDSNFEDEMGQAIVNAGMFAFYRDVYAFVEKIEDAIKRQNEEVVRIFIKPYLQGAALLWYTLKRTAEIKGLLQTTPIKS